MRNKYKLSAALLGLFALSLPAVAAEVGEIHDSAELPLNAWINKMPGDLNSLHISGFITAPNPCHTTSTSYEGDSKSNPPIYRVKVILVPPAAGTLCSRVLSPVSFSYDQQNYVGNHKSVEVFSDSHQKNKDLEIAQ